MSRNVYWVPATLTTFDFPATDFTHTPALRHEDLNALATLPQAQLRVSAARIGASLRRREVHAEIQAPNIFNGFGEDKEFLAPMRSPPHFG